jgi:AcrR family transcriptional regulator
LTECSKWNRRGNRTHHCDIEQGLTGTRARIAEAALETVKARGFAGARAREVARTGGFNQALVLYHFGSVHDVQLAALELVSNHRVRAYEPAFKNVRTVSAVARLVRDIYTEDLENGYVTMLGEMVSGGVSDPRLDLEVVARLKPWIGVVERKLRALLVGSLSESIVPRRNDLASAIIALYLAIDTLSHLDGDRTPAESLLDLGVRYAPGVEAPPSSPRTEKR